MTSWYASRRFFVGACAAVAAAAAAVVVWLVFFHYPQIEAPPDPRSRPFWDCAEEAGFTWRMNFLTDEQGRTFKINLYDHGCGVAVGDYDGSGRESIYFCNQFGKNALYRNNGDGTFTDVAEEANVAMGDRVCVAAVFVDYNNSGRQSLFVTSTRGGSKLWKNVGHGKFVDATDEAHLTHVGHSQAALFFDYNNDGHLDLLLTNTASWTTDEYDADTRHFLGKGNFGEFLSSPPEDNILYRNNGDGTFTDVTKDVGLKGMGWSGDAVAFDYDGDGFPDVFVTNMFGRSQLYHNNGGKSFSDVTLKVLGRTPWGGTGANVFDFNNDGRLDLYVVDMHSDMYAGIDTSQKAQDTAREWEKKKPPTLAGPPPFGPLTLAEVDARRAELWQSRGWRQDELLFGNAFYRNDGGGKFTEISDQAGLETYWPWGICVGDFNNDGYEDVFVPSGMGYPFYYWPSYLLMNQGNGTFVNQAAELGIEPPVRGEFFEERIVGKRATRSARCAVTGDFRGVGQLDIVVNNFNDRPSYFKNQLPHKNYVAFRLHGNGVTSNRDAIGAVVRLYQGDKIMTRLVQGSAGYLSQSSRTLHFGLGDEARIDRVEITWPDGRVEPLKDVAANSTRDVNEAK